MSLDAARVVILVFAMPGCGACEEYVPRLMAEVERFQAHGVPLVLNGQSPTRGQIPVIIVDATSPHPSVQQLADRHEVSAMPTTLVLVRGARAEKRVGSLPPAEIYEVLTNAVQR